MFITTILFAVYARRRWRWNVWLIGVASGVILVVEGAFLLANVFKIPDGGWFPLVVGVVILTLLTTWKTGRALVGDTHPAPTAHRWRRSSTGVAGSPDGEVIRVPGTAVFLYSQPGITPPGLAALVRATGALHERVYVVSIVSDDVPRVAPAAADRDDRPRPRRPRQVALHYGFMEPTTVAADLERTCSLAPRVDRLLPRP